MGLFDFLKGKRDEEEQRAESKPSPTRMQMIGMWIEEPADDNDVLGFPHPSALVDPEWEADRRRQIVNYLQNGREIAAYMGYSYCRFEGCEHPEREVLGSKDLTDGRWIWPEGLWHYVADHGVRLPDAFVADAAAHGFQVPDDIGKVEWRGRDTSFWLKWVAENTAPPGEVAGACSLERAQAICTELSTARWRASVVLENNRWKISHGSESTASEDFSVPMNESALRAYLFRHRRIEPGSALAPERAIAIANEYAFAGHLVRPYAGTTDNKGEVWWALVLSGEETPTKPFEEVDLKSIEIPQPGWAVFIPGGWMVNVVRGSDELGWRFFLEEWRRKRVGR